jgi:hypothetical protein
VCCDHKNKGYKLITKIPVETCRLPMQFTTHPLDPSLVFASPVTGTQKNCNPTRPQLETTGLLVAVGPLTQHEVVAVAQIGSPAPTSCNHNAVTNMSHSCHTTSHHYHHYHVTLCDPKLQPTGRFEVPTSAHHR